MAIAVMAAKFSMSYIWYKTILYFNNSNERSELKKENTPHLARETSVGFKRLGRVGRVLQVHALQGLRVLQEE
jgi:hypothetical protein